LSALLQSSSVPQKPINLSCIVASDAPAVDCQPDVPVLVLNTWEATESAAHAHPVNQWRLSQRGVPILRHDTMRQLVQALTRKPTPLLRRAVAAAKQALQWSKYRLVVGLGVRMCVDCGLHQPLAVDSPGVEAFWACAEQTIRQLQADGVRKGLVPQRNAADSRPFGVSDGHGRVRRHLRSIFPEARQALPRAVQAPTISKEDTLIFLATDDVSIRPFVERRFQGLGDVRWLDSVRSFVNSRDADDVGDLTSILSDWVLLSESDALVATTGTFTGSASLRHDVLTVLSPVRSRAGSVSGSFFAQPGVGLPASHNDSAPDGLAGAGSNLLNQQCIPSLARGSHAVNDIFY
jgi:hypothetical protein